MSDLAALLLETGLIQFGRYEGGKPYRLQLDLLPSYPDVLDTLIEMAEPLVGEVDHLLSTSEAVPLGIGLSLSKQVPLVYSRGSNSAAVHDLVGAYDIGHPALLLANQPEARLEQLITRAHSVGLEVRSIMVIVDDGAWHPKTLPLQSLIDLRSIVNVLVTDRTLPAGQAQRVTAWINRHPG